MKTETKIINFVDLKAQYHSIKEEIDNAIEKVLLNTAFTAGPFVESFEKNFAKAHNASYCIGVNNGTSALHVALMALGISYDDEVIVPANTFFATAEAVSLTGAKPVFVDCEESYYNINPNLIEKSISNKTKAIIAVHLFGQPAQIDAIKEIADKHNLFLIEDCAQSHLAQFNGQPVGTFGVCGCFSFYPGKNLGAYGEAGAVITNDPDLNRKIRILRDHGSEKKYHHDMVGHNYRMEGIQGAVLDVKLQYLPEWTEKRRKNASLYRKYLSDIKEIILPKELSDAVHVYHLFVIRVPDRDKLAQFLAANGIYTGIHYPIPCHLQKAYSSLNYSKGDLPVSEEYADKILSLPMYAELSEDEINFVSDKVREFYNG